MTDYRIIKVFKLRYGAKVETISEDSLDLIPSPSPSVKIQIMGGTAEGEGDGIESKLPFKIFPTLPTLQKGDLFS